MKNIRWLLAVADSKPVLFNLVLLMIAINVLGLVIKNREDKIQEYEKDYKLLQQNCNVRVDSVVAYYEREKKELNTEVKNTLNGIIEDYKRQLEDKQQKGN